MLEVNGGLIEECQGEQFSVSMIPSEKDVNVNGTVHGGIMFLLCDEAIGRYVTYKGLKGAASDGNIRYYRPGKIGERMTATVSERKVGRRLGVYMVELRNEAGVLLADAMFTIAFVQE